MPVICVFLFRPFSRVQPLDQPMAEKGDTDSAQHVDEIMLLSQQGRQGDENRHDQGIDPIAPGNLLPLPHAEITVRAGKAVVGGKEIEGPFSAVCGIHDPQDPIERSRPGCLVQQSFRSPVHTRREKNKKRNPIP